jgi:hypothetical protein
MLDGTSSRVVIAGFILLPLIGVSCRGETERGRILTDDLDIQLV